MINKLDKLCRKLNYEFNDPTLLDLALTHRSCGAHNNERLEFLGDSIVNHLVAVFLYQQFPQLREGKLSRLRAQMVKGVTLAELAKDLDLGDYLNLGAGELKSGGFRRESILADAFEALIGAIFLDSDIHTAERIMLACFGTRLTDLSAETNQKDAKTRLQELLQARRLDLPSYEVVSIVGEAHEQEFKVACTVSLLATAVLGVGTSRRIAEQEAAQLALSQLGEKLD